MPSWTHHLESSGIIVTVPAGGYLKNPNDDLCLRRYTVIRLAVADVGWSSVTTIILGGIIKNFFRSRTDRIIENPNDRRARIR